MSKIYKKLTADPDEYYRKLFAAGWLDEWADEEMDALYEALKESACRTPDFMVFSLSEYTLDPEGICIPEAYERMLHDLFSTFGLRLSQEDIKATLENNHISIFIKTPLKTVHWLFKQTDDWMHEDLIDLINDELLPDWKEKRVFHPLPPASQYLEIVFHYPDVIENAIEEGIIPDDDYFLS